MEAAQVCREAAGMQYGRVYNLLRGVRAKHLILQTLPILHSAFPLFLLLIPNLQQHSSLSHYEPDNAFLLLFLTCPLRLLMITLPCSHSLSLLS